MAEGGTTATEVLDLEARLLGVGGLSSLSGGHRGEGGADASVKADNSHLLTARARSRPCPSRTSTLQKGSKTSHSPSARVPTRLSSARRRALRTQGTFRGPSAPGGTHLQGGW